MAQSVQITCINKTPRNDPHDRINNIGGTNPDGGRWKMTVSAAIASIEAGTYQFWVSVGGKSVWVIIATSQWGNKYLKTTADGEQPNNLLSLPECP